MRKKELNRRWEIFTRNDKKILHTPVSRNWTLTCLTCSCGKNEELARVGYIWDVQIVSILGTWQLGIEGTDGGGCPFHFFDVDLLPVVLSWMRWNRVVGRCIILSAIILFFMN